MTFVLLTNSLVGACVLLNITLTTVCLGTQWTRVTFWWAISEVLSECLCTEKCFFTYSTCFFFTLLAMVVESNNTNKNLIAAFANVF